MILHTTHRATLVLDGAPYGNKGGIEPWRKACEAQAAAELEQLGLQGLAESTKLVMRFYLREASQKPDLDNMIKVVLDSLGAAGLFGPSTGGGKKGPRNTDDHWVDRIEADKVRDERPRVLVEIWTK